MNYLQPCLVSKLWSGKKCLVLQIKTYRFLLYFTIRNTSLAFFICNIFITRDY